MKIHHYLSLFRTAVQEPVGIVSILVILASLSWLGLQSPLLGVAAACLVLHWFVDLFTVHTQPFIPISKTVVTPYFHTHKQRTNWEVYGTLFFGALAFFFVFL